MKNKKRNVITGNSYQKMAARTINRELDANDIQYHAVFGMCGEVGELQSIFKVGKDLYGLRL